VPHSSGHDAERAAMRRALKLAATPGVPFGPNPRVGCVLLDAAGAVLGEGHHRGAGTAHAEVDALASARAAGHDVRGATAVVTLEPCDHTGRTGPCTQALLAAGVRRVVHALPDPTAQAGGGADTLRAAGVEVEQGLLADEAARLNRGWRHGLAHRRPLVTWKLATTLDGRSAAADGTSRWITGPAARADVHLLRARVDTVVAGTGTVLTDDPRLTVRPPSGALPADHQPLRVVAGERDLPADARVLDREAETLHLRTRDPHEVLGTLFDRGRRHVLLEGGPTLAAAWLRAGVVDEVLAYVAPVLLGAGTPTVGDLGITTIADAFRPTVTDVTVLRADGEQTDVRLTLTPSRHDPYPTEEH